MRDELSRGVRAFLCAIQLVAAVGTGSIACVSQAQAASASTSAGLSVTHIAPLKRSAAPGGKYDYTYRVTVGNSGAGAYDVQAALSSSNGEYKVRDGKADLDLLPGRSLAQSKNAITVRAPVSFDARFDVHGQPVATTPAALPPIESAAFTWKISAKRDDTVPEISEVRPTGDIKVGKGKLSISARYRDEDVGIDRASVKFFLDGRDLTRNADVSGGKIEYEANSPANGAHSVKLEVADKLGNRAVREWTFDYDGGTGGGPGLPQFLIVDYQPISKTPVAGTSGHKSQYLYSYRVTVRNSGAAAGEVIGKVTSKRSRAVVTDADVSFGAVAAKTSKASTDTFTVKAGRFFDRRLDKKVTRNGRLSYDKEGDDEDDKGQRGLGRHHADSLSSLIDAWYFLKFSLLFDWKLQARASNNAPVVSDLSPSGNVTSTDAVISASYSDDAGVDVTKVRLSLDGVDVTASSTVSANGISFRGAAFTQGGHSVFLFVPDKTGKASSATWGFTVDSIAPTISAQIPKDTIGAAPNAIISAQFSDSAAGMDMGKVRLMVDGQDVTDQATINADSISYQSANALADGTHTVSLAVADIAGNESESNWSFGVDALAPVASNLQPANGAELAADAVPKFSASYLNDGAGIDTGKVKLWVDGQDVTGQAQVSTTGVVWQPALALMEGNHSVKLTLVKNNGVASDTSWSFATRTPPVIDAMAPRELTLSAGSAVVISAQYSDVGAGVDPNKVVLMLDGVDATAFAQITPVGLSYSPAEPLAQGVHVLVLSVTDQAGNSTAASWRFTLDTGLPSISAETPKNTLLSTATPTISAQFQDSGESSSATGIDPTKIHLLVNELDVMAQAQINTSTTPGTISYTPTTALPGGSQTVRLMVADKAGNQVESTWGFSVDVAGPSISAQAPQDVFLPAGIAITIRASYGDSGAGVDASRVKLFLDGVEVSAQATITTTDIQYTTVQPLTDGTHNVRLVVVDVAGNETVSEWQFGTAQPPEVTATSPKDVTLPAGAQPTISASYRDSRVGIDPASVRLIVNSDDVTALATKTADSISYTPAQPLAAGPYTVYLEVANTTNAAVNAVWGFEVDEARVYSLVVTSPAGAQTVIVPKISVTAAASANRTYPTRLTLNSKEMQATGATVDGATTFSGDADLIDGLNTLTVQATYADGQSRSASTQVSYDAPTRITITSPADKAVLGPINANANTPGGATNLTGNVERPVTVTGRLSKPVVSVTINQQQAQLESGGLAFTFTNYFLREGANLLTAVATDERGRVSSTAISVSVDQTAPILNVEFPKSGHITRAAWIDVRGMVNDAVEAMFGAPEPQVLVNGSGINNMAAQVADRYFQLTEVPLRMGLNRLTVNAVDHLGNSRAQTVEVYRVDTGLAGLLMESGHNQIGRANTELPQPLSVLALNEQGDPIAGQRVTFEVTRGTGSLSPTQGQSATGNPNYTSRLILATTGANGKARAWYTVGKQAGPGANAVQVRSPGLGSEGVLFTANTQRGDVARIAADFGQNQITETGAEVMEILSAVVRDASTNPLPNVKVQFRIEEGNAYFADTPAAQASADGKSIIVATDKNGVVAVRPTIGNTAGLVRVSAIALKSDGGNFDTPADTVGGAHYNVRAKQAQDGPASFSGIVYTDKGAPLVGVKVSIGRTALLSTTDGEGKFFIDNVPPGRIDLFVDGRTVNPANDPSRPQWPSLHFEAYVVRGQQNQLAHAIYLPALLTSEAKTVGGNADVVLTIPGLEGFQMKVKANSVTFPDGARVGTLVVSPVTADKLPMAPPAGGAQFGIPAWTIQPSGTRFDPPIEVQMPNGTYEVPGDNLPVVQWDHDLGQYVPMGRVTVSSDGAFLITDAGSGITKAGWGGLCRYDDCKTAITQCPDCRKLSEATCPTCIPDPSKEDQKCGACKKCKGGTCSYESDPTKDRQINQPVVVDFDATRTGLGRHIEDILKRLPVYSGFTRIKFKINGVKTLAERCCQSLEDVAPYSNYQVGPIIEVATPDIPIPGYSISVPPLLELGLFTKVKFQMGGAVSFDHSTRCGPTFSNPKGKLGMTAVVEGIVKIESGPAKLSPLIVGGGGGAECPASLNGSECKGKFFVFAKTEIEYFNHKIALLDFYRSTDTTFTVPFSVFID